MRAARFRVLRLGILLPLWLVPMLGLVVRPAPAGAVEAARRVVSLNPSLTAILLALGARDVLVGVDDFSLRQHPTLAGLPTVGGLYNPSLEALVALHPDLVVLVPSAEQRAFRQRAAALHLPLLSFNPVGFEDVLASISRLGAQVGRETQARARVAAIRRVQAKLEAATRGRPRVRVVLVLQRDPTFVVGRGSFVDDMLRSVGAVNLAAGQGGPYPRVTREWLIAAQPQVLLDAAHGSEPATDYWSRWPSIPAVAQHRVVALPKGVATLPGPDLDVALRTLARAVQGPGLLE